MTRCLAPDASMGGLGCDNMTVVLVCFLNGRSFDHLAAKCSRPIQEQTDYPRTIGLPAHKAAPQSNAPVGLVQPTTAVPNVIPGAVGVTPHAAPPVAAGNNDSVPNSPISEEIVEYPGYADSVQYAESANYAESAHYAESVYTFESEKVVPVPPLAVPSTSAQTQTGDSRASSRPDELKSPIERPLADMSEAPSEVERSAA